MASKTPELPKPPQPRNYLDVFREVAVELGEYRRLLADDSIAPDLRADLERLVQDCDGRGERAFLDEMTMQRINLDYERRWFEFAASAADWDLAALPTEFNLACKRIVEAAKDGQAAHTAGDHAGASSCLNLLLAYWGGVEVKIGQYVKRQSGSKGGKTSKRMEGVYQLCLRWLEEYPKLSAKELWRKFPNDGTEAAWEGFRCYRDEDDRLFQLDKDDETKPIRSIPYESFKTGYPPKARKEVKARESKK